MMGFDFTGLDYDEVFQAIVAGKVTEEDFYEWMDDCHQESFDEGYREGLDEQ